MQYFKTYGSFPEACVWSARLCLDSWSGKGEQPLHWWGKVSYCTFRPTKPNFFFSTLNPASYKLRAPSMWINCDTSSLNSLALRTMLISTCQSVLSSKLSSRAEITADDSSANSSDSDWLPMSVRMCPCPKKPSWLFSAVIRSHSDFSEFVVTVPFTWTVKEQYVLMCFGAFVVCVFVHCQRVCIGFFPRLSPTFDFQCLFLLLLLSSSGFNVLSVTFIPWTVAPYLLRAPDTWSECNCI